MFTITLDPGGFVVRDATGAAVEVFASRFRAQARADALNGQGEPVRLFAPAPAVMPGQLGFGS